MKLKTLKQKIILAFFAVGFIPSAFAQEQNALSEFKGIVQSKEKNIADAKIILTNVDNNVKHEILSNADGSFEIKNIAEGSNYNLTILKDGFEVKKVDNVEVKNNSKNTLLVNLTAEVKNTVNEGSVQTVPLESQELESVSLIGSRGKPRTDVSRPVPVDVISAKDLAATGQLDIGQQAQYSVPSFNSVKQSINGTASYADPATLRGMSPDQVLLLVNGKRRHTFAALNLNVVPGRGSVVSDMNAIPSIAIEQLEILRDGAAAQYGSDAIAGIVNLNLKKQTNAGSAMVQTGITKEGDGKNIMGAVNYGFSLGKPKSFLNISLQGQLVEGTNRQDTFVGRVYSTTVATDDALRQQKGFWPWAAKVGVYGSNANEMGQGFFNAGYPINNEWSVYAFGGYAYKYTRAGGFFRNAVPTDGNSDTFLYKHGYTPKLPGQTTNYSIAGGIKRETKSGWNYDLSSVYGYSSLDIWANNTANASLGAASPTDFYAGQFSFAQSTTDFDLSKHFENIGVKTLNIAVGTQYRVDFYQQVAGDPDSYKIGPLGIAGVVPIKAPGSNGRPGTASDEQPNEKRTNIGAYVDIESDITNALLITTALRFENYSDFGTNVSGKFATRLKLGENFALRGSINKGFRAPSLQQIYNQGTTSTVQSGKIVQTKQLSTSDPNLKVLGIDALKAENSWNYSLGMTAKSNSGFTFTADGYIIDVFDKISLSENLELSLYPSLNRLYSASGKTQIAFFTNLLDTRTIGLDLVATQKWKLGANSTMTVSAAYAFNQTTIEKVRNTPDSFYKLNGASKVYNQYAIIDTPSRAVIETSQPQNKFVFSIGFQYKNFNVLFRETYFGEVTTWGRLFTVNGKTQSQSGSLWVNQTMGAKTISDLTLSYNINLLKGLTISMGALNLFNTYPDKNDPTRGNYFNGQTPYSRNVLQIGFNGATYFTSLNLRF